MIVKVWEKLLKRHTLLGASFNGSQLYAMREQFYDGNETLPSDFADYVQTGYQSNGVVFACILARMLALSEVEFKFQNLSTRNIFGDPRLRLLEKPWPNGSTGELVARAEQDVSLAGNFYVRRAEGMLERLRPDWMTIVSEVRDEAAVSGAMPGPRRVIGYFYTEGGLQSGNKPAYLPVDEVAHWSPIPDPMAPFRGMSWLTPVAREIVGDTAMSSHKNKFFLNAATPNLVVALREKLANNDQRDWILDQLKKRHEGLDNAYKTLLVDGGADVTVVGSNFEQMAFSVTQAAGENRICVASGVPAIIVGLKEGLQAATYSNYSQARRRFGDLTCRPLWRSLSNALERLVDVPAGTRLWYDDRYIAALQDDAKERAEIRQIQGVTIRQLTEAGYEPQSVILAVTTGDMNVLKHTGLHSVQLQPPGSEKKQPEPAK